MNYAWRNPINGLREQTRQARNPKDRDELERLEAEARFRVWTWLQLSEAKVVSVAVYKQVPQGSVTAEGDHFVATPDDTYEQFAWADPETGERKWMAIWPSHLQEVLQRNSYVSEVIVYGQELAFVVTKDQPQPPAPPPEAARPISQSSDLEAIRIQVSNFIDLADGNPAPRATAIALLDIAQTLRALAKRFQAEIPVSESDISKYLKESESEEVCKCTGDGLLPEGGFCVCEKGQERKRQQAVQNRTSEESR